MRSHERFVAWQRAHELALAVYRLTAAWPNEAKYGLTAQTRRAAISVPANIAEGAARRGPREFRRFLDIALGSLGELHYLLRLAQDLNILSDPDAARLAALRTSTGQTLWPLYRSVLLATAAGRRSSAPPAAPAPPASY